MEVGKDSEVVLRQEGLNSQQSLLLHVLEVSKQFGRRGTVNV